VGRIGGLFSGYFRIKIRRTKIFIGKVRSINIKELRIRELWLIGLDSPGILDLF